MNTHTNTATIRALPFQLRANDVVKHIINVDSRFRDSPRQSTSADFYFSLLSPVKNVLRVRVTSVEFPNNYLFFTYKRKNITIEIQPTGLPVVAPFVITIPDGNYNAGEMEAALNAALVSYTGLTVAFDESEGSFTFTWTRTFNVNTAGAGVGSWDRPFDYGLGYYMGFSRGLHVSVPAVAPSSYEVVSDQCATFAGDNYLFLRVNDFACVRQTIRTYSTTVHDQQANDFTALAKIVIREPKNYMSFDDYASQHAKEVVFPAPTDLSRLHIQALDPYGNVMDLCEAQWSFSIEVLEIKNLSLYNSIRDSITLQYF